MRLLSVFVALVSSLATAELTCENMSLELGVKEWVVENGGHFHDQLEIQKTLVASSSDSSSDEESLSFSTVGIFAKQRIRKGELLLKIPSEVTLPTTNISLDHKGPFSCSGIRTMMREIKKGKDAFFAPFMDYILQSKRGEMVPSQWTRRGRELLMSVAGWRSSFKEVMIPPKDLIALAHGYQQQCRKDKAVDDTESDLAMEHYTRTRSNHGDLVPLLDMVGHGTGSAENVQVLLEKDKNGSIIAREVKALRDIAAGEEIRVSNYVPNDPNYGTPEYFRDHGIVEDFPQRWVFEVDQFTAAFDLKKNTYDDIYVEWLPATKNETQYDTIAYFRRQLHRMVDYLEPKLEFVKAKIASAKEEGNSNEDLPKAHEVAAMQRYAEAVRVALEQMRRAINERQLDITADSPFRQIKAAKIKRTPNEHGNFPTYNEQEYDALDDQGMETLDEVESAYQRVEIKGNNETVCFVLDFEPQTCSYFSAHYHDIASHFPTRYLESVKRVAILGGGDSKILQDMLQYNSTIEKVIHLELDQVGTRLCFKHFLTDPHFDDDRIEWYFGDCARSLRMLPSDYFGTFDLVFVDMSESGPLSFGVTEDLTVWDSIAQLLNPNGMLVKNELYHEIMNEKFDNTLLLYYEQVPIIESWALTIGTNRKDLLTPDPSTISKWQDVKTHLSYVKAAATDVNDHFLMAHDYKRNDARDQGQCGASASASGSDIPLAGVMMVLEAEELDVDDDVLTDWEKFQSKITPTVTEEHGLSILSSAFASDNDGINGVLILKEGVITARPSIGDNYCAFDIHLWSAFTKLNSIRDGLSKALGSKLTSSYRLIATGMRGTDGEAEDQKTTGPPGINNRDCSTPETGKTEPETSVSKETLVAVIKESLEMIQAQANGTIAVLCGSGSQECAGLDAASSNAHFTTEAIHSCSAIESYDASQPLSPAQNIEMLDCHDSIKKQLLEAVSKNGKAVAFVIDSNAPKTMIMVLDRIMRSLANQAYLMSNQFLVLAPVQDASTEGWKQEFVEMLRQEFADHGYLFRAEVLLKPQGHKDFEIALLSGQDQRFFPRLVNVTNAIQESTGIVTSIEQIEGGIEELDLEPTNVEWLHESAYTRPAGEHFRSQRPISEQTLVQYQRDPEKMQNKLTAEFVEGIFQQGFDSWGNTWIGNGNSEERRWQRADHCRYEC